MTIKYVHTNIVSRNVKKLAKFYAAVFDCKILSEGKLKGEWVEKGTGIKNAEIKNVTLLLPGHVENGPQLEIFQYDENESREVPIAANREGFGHLAFAVEDVEATLKEVLANGGSKVGEISRKEFKSGTLTFTYATDPEDNILELQKWEPAIFAK